MTPIDIRDLSKSFGSVKALDGLSLSVETGEVMGFLGPNGAGKSTTIRVLLGLLRADGGSAQVLGLDPWRSPVNLHHRLAYVPGDVTLWPNLSGGEAIDLLTRMRGGAVRTARRKELMGRFELDPRKKARTYSKGNRQKVALVAALCTDVELYLFDEPTSGLDPLMAEVFAEEVKALRDRGRTVLLSSHVLGEVEVLCDRITIIRDGRDVESGSLSQLRHLRRSRVRAVVDDPGRLAAAEGVHDLARRGDEVVFHADDAALPAVLRGLNDAGVRQLEVTPPTLEELFLRYYDRAEPAGAPERAAR